MYTQNIFTLFRTPWIMAFFLLLGFIHVAQAAPEIVKKKTICTDTHISFPPLPLEFGPSNTESTISNTLNITEDWGRIKHLHVVITDLVTYGAVGDLTLSLSHNGTEVELLNRPTSEGIESIYCAGKNITNLRFDDEAELKAQESCNSMGGASYDTNVYSYQPNENISIFYDNNLTDNNINGEWTLSVSNNEDGEGGQLKGWCLEYEREFSVSYISDGLPEVLNSEVKSKVGLPLSYELFSIENKTNNYDYERPIPPASFKEVLVVEMTITGEDAKAFKLEAGPFPNLLSLLSNGTTGTTWINPNATYYYQVTCTPQHLGAHKANLEIRTNDSYAQTFSYPLSCEGIPTFQPDPLPNTPFKLGSVDVGQSTPLQTININEISGIEDLKIFGSTNNSDFFISPSTQTISPGGSGSLSIGCTPTGMGKRTATLVLTSNDYSFPGGLINYYLECEGLSPLYTSNPLPNASINFGIGQVGNTLTKTLQVANLGNKPLIVKANEGSFTGTGAKVFNLSSSSWSIPPTQFPKDPMKDAVNIEVQCIPPQEAATYAATLSLNTNDPRSPTVSYPLLCKSVTANYNSIPPPGTVIDFGYVAHQAEKTLNMSEIGQFPLEISSYQIEGADQEDFSVVQPAFPLRIPDGGDSVDLGIQCIPKDEPIGAGRMREARLTLNTNASNFPSPSYDLKCQGPKAQYSSNPIPGSPIDFAKVKVGQKEQRTIQIESIGDSPLIIELMEDSELIEDMKDFNVLTSFPLVLDRGSLGEVTIECKPTAPTARSATLNLKSNDLENPTVTYSLMCAGWTDPPPPPPEEPSPITPPNQPKAKLIVSVEGAGRGHVNSMPIGIDCVTGEKDCQFIYKIPTEIRLTAEAEKGSSFIGWSGPDDCLDGQVLMDMDKWCVASFAQVFHTLTITRIGEGYLASSVNSLKCNPGQCTQELAEDTTLTLTAKPASGWQFKAWEGDCDSLGQVIITSDKQCQARFVQLTDSEVSLTVEKVGQGQGTVTGQSKDAIACGETCTHIYEVQTKEILTALPSIGSVFVEWNGDCQGKNNSIEVVLTQSKLCQAHFETIETPPYAHHTLTISVTGLGKGSVTQEVQCTAQCHQPVYPESTEITLIPQAETNSTFTGWNGDCAGLDNPLTVVMDKDRHCIANFDPFIPPPEPQTYPLKVMIEGEGEASVISSPEGINITPSCHCSEMTASYASGTNVLLATIPSSGSQLVSLSGDAGCATGKIMLNQPTTCVATFAIEDPLPIQETPSHAGNEGDKSLPKPISTIKPSQGTTPPCPIEGTINVICNYKNEWQLKDVTVGEKGNISNLELDGTIYNQGWISNAQLQPGTTLTGGVLTGYISNEGVIKDVVFRGATLRGGTLAGTIISEDHLGTIQDVHLAPDTYMMGGELAGNIEGDPNRPALLENVTILEGTSLTHLVIGKGVKFEGKVNLGPGVVLINPSTPKEDLSKFINQEQDAQGQTLREITIGEAGKVSHAILEGRILNQGMIEDATIKEEGHLVGGILTGQIINHGTIANVEFQGDALIGGHLAGTIRTTEGGTLQDVELSSETHLIGGQLAGEVEGHGARLDNLLIQGTVKNVIVGQDVKNEGTLQDFEFKGELLTGGLLAGHITNTQGGTLKDIHLDEDASLTGGNLQGDIIGQADAPARLDHVNIAAGSYLEHVIIGEQVILPKNVTMGPGVQFVHPPEKQSQESSPVIPLAIGIDPTGQVITSKTTFTYNLTVLETPYPNGAMLSTQRAQEVDLSATILLASEHVGQAAEILVASTYKASPTEPPETYLLVNNKWVPWDYNLDTLKPASFSQALPAKLKVPVFKGDDLSATPGEYTVLVGYRLEGGTIVYNGRNPFYFFIDGAPKTCVLYAVQDEKLNDSQFLKIDLSRSLWGTMQTFGSIYAGRDIEGLTLAPNNPNLLYATSGDDANVEGQRLDGYFYTLDKKTAKLTMVGPTGFNQVSALGTDPVGRVLWAWGEMTVGQKREWSGLIQIDPSTGKGTPIKQFDPKESMGGLAVSPDGNKIYTSSGETLWVYDKESQDIQKACDHITKGRIEGLDMQPNGILLLGIDLNQTTTITAYDPQTCEVVNTRTYHDVNYDDIESIVWPATECNDQSWLSRDS